MLALGFGFFELWELNQKVSFDPLQRLIVVNDGVTDIDIKIDIYSNWKEWIQLSDYTGQAPPAIRPIGGDPTGPGQRAGEIYFLINDWKLVIDFNQTRVNGVLLSDDFDTAYWFDPVGILERDDLLPFYPATVSNLVTTIEVTAELQKSLDYSGAIIVDTTLEFSGSVFPFGTRAKPVNNINDAIILAEEYNISDIRLIRGDLTIDADVSYYQITADSSEQKVTLLANSTLTDATFINMSLEGEVNGYNIHADQVKLIDVSNIAGDVRFTGYAGNILLAPNASFVSTNSYSLKSGNETPFIVFNGDNDVSIRSYSGGLRVQNLTGNSSATFEFIAGKIFLDNTDVGGTASVRGTVLLTDSSAGTVVDTTATVTDLTIQDLSNVDLSNANIIVNAPTAVEIRQEIDQNSTQLANISTTTVDTNIIVQGIDSNLIIVDNTVDNINNTVSTIDTNVNDIETTVNSISSELSLVAGDVTNIDSNITVLSQEIDSINSNIINIENIISSSGGGLTPTQATMLLEMYELLGLDPTKPLVVTETARDAGNISQTIDTNNTRTIVTRN